MAGAGCKAAASPTSPVGVFTGPRNSSSSISSCSGEQQQKGVWSGESSTRVMHLGRLDRWVLWTELPLGEEGVGELHELHSSWVNSSQRGRWFTECSATAFSWNRTCGNPLKNAELQTFLHLRIHLNKLCKVQTKLYEPGGSFWNCLTLNRK